MHRPVAVSFQIYAFNTRTGSVVAGTEGTWLSGGDLEDLDQAVQALRRVVPVEGTNLCQAFTAIGTMRPAPDNTVLSNAGFPQTTGLSMRHLDAHSQAKKTAARSWD